MRSIAGSAARDGACLQSLDRPPKVGDVLEVKRGLVRRELLFRKWTPERSDSRHTRAIAGRNVVR